jgi:hypothetical protein
MNLKEEGVVDMAEVVVMAVVMIPAFSTRTRKLITMINIIE